MKNNNYYEEYSSFMLKVASFVAAAVIILGMIGLYVMCNVMHIKEGPWLTVYAISVVVIALVSTMFPGIKIGRIMWNKKHKDL